MVAEHGCLGVTPTIQGQFLRRGLLQIEATFEVDANATYPDKHESDKQKIETKNGWKIYRFTVRSTLTEEKSKDGFESGDKEKLDTFTEMYPDEDEYDNAAAAHDAESADLDVSIEALTWAIAALEKSVADSGFFQSGVGHAIRKVDMNLEKVKQLVEQQTVEQIVDAPVPQVVEELMEVSKDFAQDRVRQRLVEQTIDTLATSLVEMIVEVPVVRTPEKTQHVADTLVQHVVNTVQTGDQAH